MALPRRTVLKWTGAAIVAALPIPFVLARRRTVPSTLRADKDGVLDLAPGLSYEVLSRAGQPMSDGYRVPGLPDGMACFSLGSERFALMRNHEIGRYLGQGATPPGKDTPPEAFDKSAHGAVTRVVIDSKSGKKLSENLVLTGTLRNCAGGTSPWGWLSCEESVEEGHGYVFLCRPEADRVRAPERLVGYGRMNHESALIDPSTRIAYLSEDRSDSCLYRFLPHHPDDAFTGKLQAMRIVGHDGLDTHLGMPKDQKLKVDWVDIDRPDPIDDSVRKQAHAKGAAKIRRGEGLALHQGTLYLVATTGGKAGVGQIFALSTQGEEQHLSLVCESPREEALDCPDNLTLTPWGDIWVAEDGSGDQFLRGITPQGHVYDIARNAAGRGELTGVCLSPDARTLFVNLQREGLTFAIRGDLKAARAAARPMS